MSTPAVSVIVVSLDRPTALTRCLTGIEQLDYNNFEVIVVADPAGLAALDKAGNAGRIKAAEFAEPNISQARNLGLKLAAGEVVAFIDDDAVPEPTWLRHLTGPFADPRISAVGGYVIGRNGISLQYGARSVDRFGVHAPLDPEGLEAQAIAAPDGSAVKTEGTNCAFRRDTVLGLGGFDPAFPFYMDETDLNLRLAQAGETTAIAPLARVHHGFAASAHRRGDRMPKTLHDIGASQMVLLRKHAPGDRVGPVLDAVRAEQRARLARHLVSGACEPRDLPRLIDTLEAGIIEGKTRTIRPLAPISATQDAFLQFEPRMPFNANGYLAGRVWNAANLRNAARDRVGAGERTTLFLFSPTALFHRVRFTSDGYWEQTGGVFGRSDRSGPLLRYFSFETRVAQEIDRVAVIRNLPNCAKTVPK